MTEAGVLLVDKPSGWTSHDVVARCRRLAGTRRVGHAGTLDPMATGLLVLGVNQGTKLLTFFVGCDKTYSGTIRLGQSTLTDDAEGEVTASAGAAGVSDSQIDAAIGDLSGAIQQVPSAVSAIKVKGERSYVRARKGEDVALPARPVTVRRFEVLDRRTHQIGDTVVIDLDVVVEVSSGTYVRALARDLGAALHTGGHLTSLRREGVGHLDLARSAPLAELEDAYEQGRPLPLVSLPEAAAELLPTRMLTAEETAHVRHGRRLPSRPERLDPVAAIGPDGDLVAVIDESRSMIRSHVVFPTGEQS
ncbi:tRNA pseudouridine(55) synthase TruB [Demetria terragena]|uniref:tRNA pseudouridine(55) synthase TruB n=1 Tax=Demetria terragena TaxID=63959 RepID=UPI00035FC0E1|nr:tRNA pseudouridine(55) synthase TruB [Demetria terragena]